MKATVRKYKIYLNKFIMFLRTFLRIMFNSLYNNAITAFALNCVNFCNNRGRNSKNFLKFSQNVPLNNQGTNIPVSFRSITGDEIDCKNVKTC